MAEQLTKQQHDAVYDRGGRLLVAAAAGSGKTKVLVDRLMSYLTDPVDPANIDDFLMITYTKAAAAELRGKIAKKLSEKLADDPENYHLMRQQQRLYLTKVSTVHSFCGDILREYAYRLHIPCDFRIADENECNELRIRVMEKVLDQAYQEQGADFRAFVDSQGLGRDDRLVPQIVLQVYDSANCHLDPRQWLDTCLTRSQTEEKTDASQTVYGQFLIEQLTHWLGLQTAAMERCAQIARQEGLDKPAALFDQTLDQLRKLGQAQTWEQVRQARAVDFGRLNFPRNYDNEHVKACLKNVREECKKGLTKRLKPFADDSARILTDLAASADAVRGLIGLTEAFSQAYDRAKQARHILDFSDMEHKMLDLLLGKGRNLPTAAAREIGSRFREVMVDEYQDSNEVQDAIYNALTAQRNNLFMVGDVKQSIYQFRLADPGIFLDKYARFVPKHLAQPGDDRKIVLSANFRSSAGVLEGCNDVFRMCMCPQVGGLDYGEEEALHEGRPHIPLGVPETELHCIDVQQETYPEEAAFVASHIHQLLQTGQVREGEGLRPVRPEDIVILLRSPGSSGVYFQQALDRLGIPYATGGGVDLLQTEEIGTLHALLQVIQNPRQDIPLVATMASPIFGFTADDLAQLRAKNKYCAFYDALLADDSEKSRRFLEILHRLRTAVRRYSLSILLEQVLLETDFEEIYAAMEGGQVRLSNIRTFYQLAVDFEAMGNRDLGRFLEHLETLAQKGLLTAGENASGGRVTIMSVHKSKGLEFPVVYLCGLGRQFNTESQRANVLCHKDLGIGLSAVDQKHRLRYPTIAKRAIGAKMAMESVSEELRVLYVAMTRACDRLIMTYASNTLEKDLSQMVQHINMGNRRLLIEGATCPGDWVLLTALHKTEAGALFQMGGYPMETATGENPWKICISDESQPVVDTQVEAETAHALSPEALEQLRRGLGFQYPHAAATVAPSKLTATGLKGRFQDEEAAEQTPIRQTRRQWRPLLAAQPRGADYGNAVHAIMQHIDFAACESEAGVSDQIRQLVAQGFVDAQLTQRVDPRIIAAFFATELGQRVRRGQVEREFKFSLLQDAAACGDGLDGEQVLLQGVVDCALMEEDGITVIDFKTDFVTEETLPQKVAFYASQVNAYAKALERIFGQPVKAKKLYFFHLNRFADV